MEKIIPELIRKILLLCSFLFNHLPFRVSKSARNCNPPEVLKEIRKHITNCDQSICSYFFLFSESDILLPTFRS